MGFWKTDWAAKRKAATAAVSAAENLVHKFLNVKDLLRDLEDNQKNIEKINTERKRVLKDMRLKKREKMQFLKEARSGHALEAHKAYYVLEGEYNNIDKAIIGAHRARELLGKEYKKFGSELEKEVKKLIDYLRTYLSN